MRRGSRSIGTIAAGLGVFCAARAIMGFGAPAATNAAQVDMGAAHHARERAAAPPVAPVAPVVRASPAPEGDGAPESDFAIVRYWSASGMSVLIGGAGEGTADAAGVGAAAIGE